MRWRFVLGLLVCAALPAGAANAAESSRPGPGDSLTVVFKTVAGRSLRLFVDLPAKWKKSDTRPAFIFFHGGAWVGGDAETSRAQTRYFAERGMVGISVEYRLLAREGNEPPAVCCADAKSAMRYIRAHAAELGVDSNRIAASGGSAGGHLAAFTALVDGMDDLRDDISISPRPQALVLFNPVLNNGPKHEGGWGNGRSLDRVKEFSPAHNVWRGAPPTIMFLGRKDALIPVATLERFQASLRDVGTRCDLMLYDDQEHAFFNRSPYTDLTLAEADRFLRSLGWLGSVSLGVP